MAGSGDFWRCIKFILVSGENIKFWEDVWVVDILLSEVCPNIYWLAVNRHTSVYECYDEIRSIWSLRLRRDLNDWEVEELLNLLGILGNLKPYSNRSDSWRWNLNQKGLFTSKSFYIELADISWTVFPYKGIWISFVLFRITFFIWICYLDKILTLNHLQSRGWHLTNRCSLCLEEEELVDHLFIHCPLAK